MSQRSWIRRVIDVVIPELYAARASHQWNEDRAHSRGPAIGRPIESLENRLLFNAGGGWEAGGIVGNYYNNGTFSGSPTFTRTDVRVDFTPTSKAPGGSLSTDPAFGAIHTASTWSVSWDANVVPKYTETYTLKEIIGSGDTGVVYFGTGAEGSNPSVLSGSGTQTTTVSLIAGDTYNLEMNYVHNGGSTWQAGSLVQHRRQPLRRGGHRAGHAGRHECWLGRPGPIDLCRSRIRSPIWRDRCEWPVLWGLWRPHQRQHHHYQLLGLHQLPPFCRRVDLRGGHPRRDNRGGLQQLGPDGDPEPARDRHRLYLHDRRRCARRRSTAMAAHGGFHAGNHRHD